MKTVLTLVILILLALSLPAQIITPQIKANFGVDADLRANYFNGAALTGNDEWFSSGNVGAGKYVIDTSGAAAITSRYTTNPASLNWPIVRTMSFPPFSEVNHDMLIDAVFVRDYHGDDSTVFASGSNKNGQSPGDWSSPVSQSVPDKNEILDVFMHVRRAGILAADTLWMFGGISIENTTGNRYFDFEMYQSDIFFNRSTQSFSGFGPDAGHTSWKFDAAGNVIQPGDIILTAEYSSSSLSMIEARIWVDRQSMAVTPVTFNLAGDFDGAGNGAEFGYASIIPKSAGAFYNGLQSSSNTWGGPFRIVLGNNTITDNYTSRQFMEFAVNLTKLGLDPVTLLGGSTCDRPFNKVLIKTRASTSFTSELKDFVGPFDFFNAAKAKLFTDLPVFCGVFGVSNIKVINPLSTSTYTWSTPDGNFSDLSNPASVFVDAPGTYIVTQKLRPGCPVYAKDTIMVRFDASCGILPASQLNFAGTPINRQVNLSWKPQLTEQVDYYDLARSTDGIHFYSTAKVSPDAFQSAGANLSVINDVQFITSSIVYYRLTIVNKNNERKYSPVIKIDLAAGSVQSSVSILPNPVQDKMKLTIFSATAKNVQVKIFDGVGKLMRTMNNALVPGNTAITIADLDNWHNGIYTVKVLLADELFVKRILLAR